MTINRGTRNQATLSIEHPNGEAFNFNKNVRALLKNQDMVAWRRDSEAFRAWIGQQLATAVRNLEYILK